MPKPTPAKPARTKTARTPPVRGRELLESELDKASGGAYDGSRPTTTRPPGG